MKKRCSRQITGHISTLSVEGQFIDIMPCYSFSGNNTIRVYANNTLWYQLLNITADRWINRLHAQGEFHIQGQVLLHFKIWDR